MGRTPIDPDDLPTARFLLPLAPGIAVIDATARFSSAIRVVRMGVRVMGGIMENMLGTGMTGICRRR